MTSLLNVNKKDLPQEVKEILDYNKLLDRYDNVFEISPKWYTIRDFVVTEFNNKMFFSNKFDKVIDERIGEPKEERILRIKKDYEYPVILHTAYNYSTYLKKFYEKIMDNWALHRSEKTAIKVIQAVEEKARTITLTNQFVMARLNVYLQKVFNIEFLPYPKASEIALTLPVRVYYLRVVRNLGLPKLTVKDNFDHEFERVKKAIKEGEKLESDLASKHFAQLEKVYSENPVSSKLMLTTAEKLEAVAEKVLYELINDDEIEIESP